MANLKTFENYLSLHSVFYTPIYAVPDLLSISEDGLRACWGKAWCDLRNGIGGEPS